MYAMQNIVSWA